MVMDLQIYVSDPLHDSMAGPDNGVDVLLLTPGPAGLQSLQKHMQSNPNAKWQNSIHRLNKNEQH